MSLPLTPPTLPDFGDPKFDMEAWTAIVSLGWEATDALKGRYLHWDQLRHRPLPEKFDSHEVWWYAIKTNRMAKYRTLGQRSTGGRIFRYSVTETMQGQLHRIDQQASGQIDMHEEMQGKHTRDRHIINSLIDEAITSSQLEGASTSHRVAKAMIRENRTPGDHSERMILNNYAAMSFIRDTAKREPLSESLLLELHSLVTMGTLENIDDEGQFKMDNTTAIWDNRTGDLLHQPPPVAQLPARMKMLYEFANEKNSETKFIHPVVRAITLHFLLAYIHPFVDGNGRTARALFYWLMAREGYWLMEFISISSIIKKSVGQYRKAYLFVENDGDDLTYFIEYHLGVIKKSIDALIAYLQNVADRNQNILAALKSAKWRDQLNHRQIALLSGALKDGQTRFTVASHGKAHNVAKVTARQDLNRLADLKLLTKQAIGRTEIFLPSENLNDLLQ